MYNMDNEEDLETWREDLTASLISNYGDYLDDLTDEQLLKIAENMDKVYLLLRK